ncbi:thiolase domain-containing protein [Candidatus Bathyarchaeota archaeon]|mgnify:CR=1 FL=1|nr:MAG: thiolase domain-containing protein [Candidatus Bathyarchaeota archaeon]
MKALAAITGAGCTKVGEHWERSLLDLAVEACLRALEEAGNPPVRALYVGNAASELVNEQGNLAALLADALALEGIKAAEVRAGDASGALALHQACLDVSLGQEGAVLVCGVEKMTDVMAPEVERVQMLFEDSRSTFHSGVTVPGLCALLTALYMERYKASYEDIVLFAVNDHRNAANNPCAQYPFPITVETVMGSPLVADPIRLFDTAGIGDGAAALVLTRPEEARKACDAPVAVVASEVATDRVNVCEREDLLCLRSLRLAAKRALKRAGLEINRVSFFEVHNTTSILGILALEALGLAEPGRGVELLREGEIAIGGRCPTNTMGGLKGRGHPWGATGIYQAVETVWQLRGEAGKNQVEGAEVGLAHNMCGLGSISCVHVFARWEVVS